MFFVSNILNRRTDRVILDSRRWSEQKTSQNEKSDREAIFGVCRQAPVAAAKDGCALQVLARTQAGYYSHLYCTPQCCLEISQGFACSAHFILYTCLEVKFFWITGLTTESSTLSVTWQRVRHGVNRLLSPHVLGRWFSSALSRPTQPSRIATFHARQNRGLMCGLWHSSYDGLGP